VVVVRDVVDE
jgi:hypothetical protein